MRHEVHFFVSKKGIRLLHDNKKNILIVYEGLKVFNFSYTVMFLYVLFCNAYCSTSPKVTA